MLTPADGESPTMRTGFWPNSDRHVAFDADVVFHEFVHGVTNRLVGGRSNRSAMRRPQSRGMGEGFSDYFALTVQSFGKPTEKQVTGSWSKNDSGGIRKFPYDENFPDSYGDLGTGRYRGSRPEHAVGEIWCATLMEMTRNIGSALGSRDAGYRLSWQIVVDGLKMTSANPSFLVARDEILQSIDDLHDSGVVSDSDHSLVLSAAWRAFAKYGMGVNAFSQGPELVGIMEDDTIPA